MTLVNLATVLFRPRHLLAQALDLGLLALNQIIAFVARGARVLVGHALVMPESRGL